MKKFYIWAVAAFVVGFGAAAAWQYLGGVHLLGRFVITTAEKQITKDEAFRHLLDTSLGFDGPKTYLILLLNNTEIRPGGGFIGAYALVQMTDGHPDLITIEGTEVFDGHANPKNLPLPPEPIKKYLKVERWYFRDSNWSPDFAQSARQALDFYTREGGYLADQIDGVIGFTPTVLEQFLAINGPVTVNGFNFDKDNVVEKLEYEVEYGYVKRGVQFADRKGLMRDFGIALIKNAKYKSIWRVADYLAMVKNMLQEKQIMFYSTNAAEQTNLENLDYAGRVKAAPTDYLLWSDANLGALKTDASLVRQMTYSITPSTSGQYVAAVTMHYDNKGKQDWRTTRYRTYARVFVPAGSRLLSVVDGGKTITQVDQGLELGKTWFGFSTTVDIGTSKDVTFNYYLPPQVLAAIKSGNYQLNVQKQLGAYNNALTLGLNFDRTVSAAAPGEVASKHNDARYDLETILSGDKSFNVILTPAE